MNRNERNNMKNQKENSILAMPKQSLPATRLQSSSSSLSSCKEDSKHSQQSKETVSGRFQEMERVMRSNDNDDTIHKRPSPFNGNEDDPSSLSLQQTACDLARESHSEDLLISSIPDLTEHFPTFEEKEIVLGKCLGKGSFGVVYEVHSVHLFQSITKTEDDYKDASHRTTKTRNGMAKPQIDNTENTNEGFESGDGEEDYEDDDRMIRLGSMESRQFIAMHCQRTTNYTSTFQTSARYAMKRLAPHIKNHHESLWQGIADMANETRLLASLDHHPNIIKLRAICHGDRFHKDYFILLDRLSITLTEQLALWKKEKKAIKGIKGKIRDRDGAKKLQLLECRIFHAYDLNSALAHLHKHGIIHRDLKPDNIGFDIVSK